MQIREAHNPVADRAAKRRAEWETKRRAEIEERLKAGTISAKQAAELLAD